MFELLSALEYIWLRGLAIVATQSERTDVNSETEGIMAYSSGPFTADDMGFVNLADTKVLAAVAKGEIDLNRVAREALANRGLDLEGKWIGFRAAEQLLLGNHKKTELRNR